MRHNDRIPVFIGDLPHKPATVLFVQLSLIRYQYSSIRIGIEKFSGKLLQRTFQDNKRRFFSNTKAFQFHRCGYRRQCLTGTNSVRHVSVAMLNNTPDDIRLMRPERVFTGQTGKGQV